MYHLPISMRLFVNQTATGLSGTKCMGLSVLKNGREKDNCFKQEILLMTNIPSCALEIVVLIWKKCGVKKLQ